MAIGWETPADGVAATVIGFINHKGGCGKSSCCFHLGGQLARDGMRVLLIDADPQGALSQRFFGSAFNGVSLVTAQKLARHSTPMLTAPRYTHIDLQDQEVAVDRLLSLQRR